MANAALRSIPSAPVVRYSQREWPPTLGILDHISIYATPWRLKFPRYGDVQIGCEWIKVKAQRVPSHIGSSTPGFGYENGAPYTDFLPPSLVTDENGDTEFMRVVVIATEVTDKGTTRNSQE